MKSQSTIRYAAASLMVLVAAMTFTPQAQAGKPAAIVATISGGGTANMDDGQGRSAWGLGVQLLSDGSARGHFECVDQMGDAFPGNFIGQVTSWSLNGNGEWTVSGVGRVVSFPPYFFIADGLPFTVTIQAFGGPGVGHWTFDVPDLGGRVCTETVITGQITVR